MQDITSRHSPSSSAISAASVSISLRKNARAHSRQKCSQLRAIESFSRTSPWEILWFLLCWQPCVRLARSTRIDFKNDFGLAIKDIPLSGRHEIIELLVDCVQLSLRKLSSLSRLSRYRGVTLPVDSGLYDNEVRAAPSLLV